ncbi:MAG: C4-dicarboxylate ABC transporter permease [Salibaculum sp.]|uniref:TRAP transporter small permease subunit n=1 Tax=Roseovarius halophilus (ex Wu et al. 2025) TaxID=3376060 RepID=UPI00286FCBAC|nr:TRAP transporter small permease subunit [Salibaculum sp.]MDR9427566.1 C4-dicarboxylate ABC transporter permease [Salibaculum sp.]MDR9481555.1 C4-dicarboxylate ABC transporter permease [Salibaculum sp.]
MEEDAAQAGFWSSYDNGFTRWVERLQGNAAEGADPIAPAETTLGALVDALLWVIGNILESIYNILFAVTHPGVWLDWLTWTNTTEDKEALMRVVYYGGSTEFFFAVFTLFLILTAVGFTRRGFMWATVRVLEGFANKVGRTFAWAGLLMVLIQVVIIFMQRVFAVAEIPGFGLPSFDVSWWAESLKLYNAMIVTLCVTYTFVQGGHVRVDLIYAAVGHRAKRIIDMFGSLIFMVPAAVLIWMYGWYFLWRHLITPKPNAGDTLDRTLLKARAVRWNVETISFSPNGFNAYFLFKVLLVAFTALVLIQAVAFFYRSWLEWVEGEESAGKYLDKDSLGAGEEAYEGTH